LIEHSKTLDGTRLSVGDGDALSKDLSGTLAIESNSTNFFGTRMVSEMNGRIMPTNMSLTSIWKTVEKVYPRGQSKYSSGLTTGSSVLAMKLPSTYM
jgi:hypothetical protein